MTNYDIVLKKGDKEPIVYAKVLKRDKTGYPIYDVQSVVFHIMDLDGNEVARGDGEIVNADESIISYAWGDETLEPGAYNAEFKLHKINGNVMTVPSEGYISVFIYNDIVTPLPVE